MATYTYAGPVKNAAFIFYDSLVRADDTRLFKSGPTMAAGDFQISKDGGAFANLANLPTNTPGTFAVKFNLTSTEMNADNVLIVASDQTSPPEWCDRNWNFNTNPGYPANFSILAIDGSGDVTYNNIIATPTNANVTQWNGHAVVNENVNGIPLVDVKYFLGTLSAGAPGYAGLDWGHINAPTTAQNLSGTTIATSQVVASVTGAVGSVTGAVGSVTGNVGGNVVGSVGSVVAAVTTTTSIKKNTAFTGFEFVMRDSTTHLPQTGLTVTGQVSIDGGAFGNLTNSVSELSNGVYKVNLAAADVNGNFMCTLKFTATNADTNFIHLVMQT